MPQQRPPDRTNIKVGGAFQIIFVPDQYIVHEHLIAPEPQAHEGEALCLIGIGSDYMVGGV